ncbi:MAG: hypothetical protein OXE77_11510 [Flavobacteriaceae bacterium]|nr:hypothetical protein [Flavobacteriaceae bacterium]MCY4268016.1 hypothetical protein [Flavobacteriaceae bacterium]
MFNLYDRPSDEQIRKIDVLLIMDLLEFAKRIKTNPSEQELRETDIIKVLSFHQFSMDFIDIHEPLNNEKTDVNTKFRNNPSQVTFKEKCLESARRIESASSYILNRMQQLGMVGSAN